MISAQVDGDPLQPGRKLPLPDIVVGIPDDAAEDLLRQILRLLLMPGKGVEQVADPVAMPMHQLGGRDCVPGCDRSHQIIVCVSSKSH